MTSLDLIWVFDAIMQLALRLLQPVQLLRLLLMMRKMMSLRWWEEKEEDNYAGIHDAQPSPFAGEDSELLLSPKDIGIITPYNRQVRVRESTWMKVQEDSSDGQKRAAAFHWFQMNTDCPTAGSNFLPVLFPNSVSLSMQKRCGVCIHRCFILCLSMFFLRSIYTSGDPLSIASVSLLCFPGPCRCLTTSLHSGYLRMLVDVFTSPTTTASLLSLNACPGAHISSVLYGCR